MVGREGSAQVEPYISKAQGLPARRDGTVKHERDLPLCPTTPGQWGPTLHICIMSKVDFASANGAQSKAWWWARPEQTLLPLKAMQ